MKLITASYFQEENHGNGRKIGISPSKPDGAECDFRFDPLDPGQLYWDYHYEKKRIGVEKAGESFVENYSKKCAEFVEGVKKQAEQEGKSVTEILPFKDGDTLLSWEKKGHTTYRRIAAEHLRKLGYEIEES